MMQANNVRVIDGDTLKADIDLGFNVWLHDQSIRLADIDTPELKSKEMLCSAAGRLARRRVIELIGDKSISFQTKSKQRDKFGRILATIFNHYDMNINQTLLQERLAVEYSGKSKNLTSEKQQENIEYLNATGKLLTHSTNE